MQKVKMDYKFKNSNLLANTSPRGHYTPRTNHKEINKETQDPHRSKRFHVSRNLFIAVSSIFIIVMDYKEKNDKFLSWFWDLASDESELRLSAAEGILSHVELSIVNQKGLNDDGTMVIDLDYALKRLIRGLSSSRDSARHGFATCLSALLASGHVTLQVALPLIDESTHIRGKIKGSEERDLIFGKLFAYLAIARSGILGKDGSAGVDIFRRLLELHKMRNWIREVVSEAFLVILHAMDPNALLPFGDGRTNAVEHALAFLSDEDMFQGEVSDWAPWQLQLALGLQQFANDFKGKNGGDDAEDVEPHKGIRKALKKMLPSKRMATPELLLGPLTPVLVASAAGFPKIHRVWDLLLGSIFGLVWGPTGLSIPEGRAESLGRKQEDLLHALVSFMVKNLLVPSNEKRSLAFRLTVRLAIHTPVNMLPQVLHKSILRGMLSARVNRKHTLHALAGLAVRDLVSAAVPWDNATSKWRSNDACSASDAEARVAIASVLVSHASANFDVLAGVPAVGSLLEGLSEDAVLEHVQALARLVAAAAVPEPSEAEMQATSENAEDDAENENVVSVHAKAAAALEALASLTKNTKLSCRGTVCSVSAAVFTRVACFVESTLPAELTSKSSKKSKKGPGAACTAFRESVDVPNAVVSSHMLNALESVSSEQQKDCGYPASLVVSASGKLLTLLAETGHLSTYQLSNRVNAPADKEDKEKESTGPSILTQATAVAVLLTACKIGVRAGAEGRAVSVDGMDIVTPQVAFSTACAPVLDLCSNSKQSPLADTLSSLLGHASFQMLAANAELAQAVSDIASVASDITKAASNDGKASTSTVNDDEENVLDEQLGVLLDACFEFVAQNDDAIRAENLSVKGVANAIKRVWACAGRTLPIGLGILNNIVSAVVGEDADDDEEEEQRGAEDLAEVDKEEEDDEVEKVNTSSKKKEAEDKRPPAQKKVLRVDDDESEEEEVIDADAVMNILAEENSDDEAELEALRSMLPVAEHHVEADAALIQMLEMRKANRKSGLLDAKRKQLLVRSRAVDMLEAVLTRIESPELLVPLLPPLLTCLRRIQTGLTQSLAEGRSFESRLRGFIDVRICKKRFVLNHFGDKETDEGIAEMVDGLCSQLHPDLQCPFAPMRQMAGIVLLSISRATIGGDCDDAKKIIGNFMAELLADFFKLKKSRLAMSIFDDNLSRFADFFVPYCIGILGEGCASAASPFLRSEASRMLQTIVRRFSSLTEATRGAIFAALPAILKSLSAAFAQSTESNASETSIKRLKPLLQCLRDICLLPVCVGNVAEMQKLCKVKGKGSIDVSGYLGAISTSVTGIAQRQPALNTLAQQAQAAISGIYGTASTPAKEDKSGGKKRKVVDVLEAAEQRVAAQMETETNEEDKLAAIDAAAKARGVKWHASSAIEANTSAAIADTPKTKAKKSKMA